MDDFKPGEVPPALDAAMRAGITRALKAGYAILKRGGTSVDAVEAALRSFESDTIFDAGRGAVVNRAGVAELDAAIMDGRTLKAGSVGAVQHIAHPVTLARMIMDRTPHIMLVGPGAEAFALSQGMDTVPNSYLVTAGMRKQYE